MRGRIPRRWCGSRLHSGQEGRTHGSNPARLIGQKNIRSTRRLSPYRPFLRSTFFLPLLAESAIKRDAQRHLASVAAFWGPW